MTWIQVQLATCYIHESGLQSQVPLVQTTQIIIECDCTVICRDNAKNKAGVYHTYITDSQKYHQWTGIKPKPAFRSPSQLTTNKW